MVTENLDELQLAPYMGRKEAVFKSHVLDLLTTLKLDSTEIKDSVDSAQTKDFKAYSLEKVYLNSMVST